MSVLIASDLDRTLIYSAAALGLTMPDAEAPRLLCVETYQQKPLSYMTETAARLLERLHGQCVFVPTTTRTREQYRRISLPGGPARYAVCANGGHILFDGESDPDWHARVRRELESCAPLQQVCEHLRRAAGDGEWVLKQRVADELFAYLVVDRARLPEAWVKELAEWAGVCGWTVSLQGRKIYAVPGPLTKSAAVAEVARRTGAARTYAAGDSLLDADLLLGAGHGWMPGHGELADSGWAAAHVTALPERGVAAGERILREMLAVTEPVAQGTRPVRPAPAARSSARPATPQ
ncbi:HAD family hydrolase [Streptomyces ovatisporus]|uniref:HAD family hydrolase n=1 Tax=Streptomyces ovatisporus TaxID=1128682 RepID=A0ABV8ZZH3_9ACTN